MISILLGIKLWYGEIPYRHPGKLDLGWYSETRLSAERSH